MSENTLRIPKDARWACRSCAACCHGFDYGPVEEATIERLRQLDVAAHWAPAAEVDAWATQRRSQDGRMGWFLTHVDGHCVFLQPDNLCAIHAKFGPEAKPGFCREFPYYLVEDPKGWTAVVRPDCEGWVESFVDGPSIASEASEMFGLPRVVPRKRFFPSSVSILPDVDVDLATWMTWEADLLAGLEGPPDDPAVEIGGVRRRIQELAGLQGPVPSSASAHLATRAVAVALDMVMQRVVAMPTPPGGLPHQVVFARDMAQRMTALSGALAQPVERVFDNQGRAYIRAMLKSALLSKRWQSEGQVGAGLGRFLWEVEAAAVLGRIDAAVQTREMARQHTSITRFVAISMIQQVLAKARPAFVDLFLHAG
jgi:Fe-S-cluster containining protein